MFHQKLNRKNIYTYLGLIMVLSILITLITPYSIYGATTKEPEVDSDYYILMEADTGNILYEKNSDVQCYPASVTKLMTALIVVENCNLSDTVTISKNAVNSVEYGDANAALKEGEEFTVEQALNVMLIKSANDMAYALAEHTGGSLANFANMMNKKASELGCINTHFSNASGLTDTNHYTTAHDMALIVSAVTKNPTIMNILAYSKTYSVPPTNKTTDVRYYRMSHALLPDRTFTYENFIGGKTGYTDAAGHTLASIAQKNDLKLIAIVFQSTDEQRYLDTISLFEYGFNNFKKISLAENEKDFSSEGISVLSNLGFSGNALNTKGSLTISLPSDASLVIPNSLEFHDLTRKINYTNGIIDVTYSYRDYIAGTTTLDINTIEPDSLNNTGLSITSNSALPYVDEISVTSADVNKLLYENDYVNINIWMVIGLVCIVFLVILFIFRHKFKKKPGLRF